MGLDCCRARTARRYEVVRQKSKERGAAMVGSVEDEEDPGINYFEGVDEGSRQDGVR